MRRIVINEKQTALLFKNGKFAKVLEAGKYLISDSSFAEVFDSRAELESKNIDIRALLSVCDVASSVDVVDVKETELGMRFVDGIFVNMIKPGKRAYFKKAGKNEFRVFPLTTEVSEDFPKYLFSSIPDIFYIRYVVEPNTNAVLYIDGKLTRVLEPGTHYFWRTNEKVNVQMVDMRVCAMVIQGQEIMTSDKVPLRINFALNYKITDAAGLYREVKDPDEQMRQIAQMALREEIGRQKLDDILGNKDGITAYVFEKMKERCKEFYIDIVDAGVRDIILPGAVRDILSTVLIAEKKAQANVITRREEVASTRSLLNTAKLMEENPTLYKLKELEYVERICENVGNINIGGGDILTELTKIMGNKVT